MALVLASGSAIRAELLARAGVEIVRDPADIDEASIKDAFRAKGEDPAVCAAALAAAKADPVSRRRSGALVVGADQLLVCGDAWFDKPADRGAARDQLLALRGRMHELVTAVCVARDGAVLWRHLDRPRLTMRRFSDEFLDEYLERAGTSVLASVGAYQLEALGAQLFERIEGDYFAILGLPLLPLLAFLRRENVLPT